MYSILLQATGRSLVFANSKAAVKELAGILQSLGLPALPLHASMQQRQRLKVLDRARQLESVVLVATDVAARGLDIPAMRLVVQYNAPKSLDQYVHRAGRTGKAG